jgi:SAM-dependent methyltransferase
MPRPWEVWDAAQAEAFVAARGTPGALTPAHHERMTMGQRLLVGESVLDVGCGVGYFYRFAKEKVHSYIGVDSSEDMLARARRFHPEGDFRLGDVYALDEFPLVDTVCCQALLIHLPELEPALLQLWSRAAKALVFSIPIGDESELQRQPRKDGHFLILRREKVATIEDLIAGLGGVGSVARTTLSRLQNTYWQVRRSS